METAPKFDLEALKRYWIGGIAGENLFRRALRRVAQIEQAGEQAQTRGVMILEHDPLRFAAAFFASVHSGVPVILANPKWRRLEWERVVKLVNPAVIFGQSPISEQARAGIQHPKPGAILIPTGGSTGGVKFAIHKWSTLEAACEGLSSFIGPGPINSCCVLPLYHVSWINAVGAFVCVRRANRISQI